ncbi:MAG: sigma-70 family RNA polymerase sigma factor [Caldilineaceae bacterium]
MADDLPAIVQQAKQGDEHALTALVQRYGTPVQRVAQTILSNRDDAEDAVQDAWLLAIRKLDTLRDPEQFGPWFYRIAANVALRKRQKRAAQQANLAALALFLQPPDEQSPGRNYRDLLPVAMDGLSSKDQMVITLHYFGGVPVAQLAALLEIPPGTVKSRLHHARQVLRKELLHMSTQSPNHPVTQSITRPEHIPADFRRIIGSSKGQIEWQSIFTGDFAGWAANGQPIAPGTVPAHWEVVGKDGLVGDRRQNGVYLTYGDPQWRDVEFSLLVTPLAGGNAQILFRVAGPGQGFYLVDLLLGWQTIAVSRVTFDEQGQSTSVKLSVVDYPLTHQHEYAVTVAARGHSITTYIDGALVNQVTDGAWLHGQVGLNIWEAKTLFRDIRVRVLD